MDLFKKKLDKLAEWMCISLMGIMTLLVTYQVVVRYFFNSPSAFSEALSKYLFVWLVLFGAAYVFGLREHMNIVFLKNLFPTKVRIIVEMIGELTVLAFSVMVMIVGGYQGAIKQMTQMDSSLAISMGWIYAAIPLSGAMMVFYSIYNERALYRQLIGADKATDTAAGLDDLNGM
ncbi:TRAP transporter small permease [Oscillospiraceae bacterium PP1C4]